MTKKLYIPVVALAFIAVVLQLVNIHLAGIVASDSVTVKKLQDSIGKLNEENQVLKSQVLTETSFESIASRAAALGFTESNKYITLRQLHLSYSR